MERTLFTETEQQMLLKLSEQDRSEYLQVCRGERIPSLMSDVIAKKLFDADAHPEWLEFIFRQIMQDESLSTCGSFRNEGSLQSFGAKRIFFDVTARLIDGRIGNIEFQSAAQDFFLQRGELYASDMLLIQYGVERGQSKDSVDYASTRGVILIFLLKNSPKRLKEFESSHYIHRFRENVADSGLKYAPLQVSVYVQVDKAAWQYRQGTDGENNPRLQRFLAMLYDANEEHLREEVEKDELFSQMIHEAVNFVQDREVQKMLLEEKYAMLDYNTSIRCAREEGEAIGEAKGDLIRLIRQVCKKLLKGVTEAEIAEDLETDQGEITEISNVAKGFAPSFDQEKIYEAIMAKRNSIDTI